jgi:septal ring factor EnvC (AmiA/AmiB activator)
MLPCSRELILCIHNCCTCPQEFEAERGDWEKVKDSHRKAQKEQMEERDMLSREIQQLKRTLEEEKKHIMETEAKRKSDVKALQDERVGLRQKVEQQRAIIQRFQVDEQQRMSQLKAALNTYFTTTPKLTDSDFI